MKNRQPVLLWTGMLLLIGLACAASGGNANTPTIAVTQMLTAPANGSPSIEPVTAVPTATKIPAFFIEEFGPDFDVNHWQQFTLGSGSPSQLVIQQEDDYLLFDLGSDDLYVYYMYKPYTYKNTKITLNAQNLGRNNNNISLICRMHDEGRKWYEFSVTSSGLWTLFAFDQIYHILGSGGTNLLAQGREENEYQMSCKDDQIQLFINGQEVRTINDTRFGFQEGYAGFNISSIKDYSVLPITVQVNRFEITLPE